MPLSFPSSPSVNQTATLNGRTYRWTGSVWEFVSSGGSSGLTWSSVPASATASGTAGQIAYDGDYLYVAVGSSRWERTRLKSWPLDPHAQYVSLLLRMENAGSTFTDSSPWPKTITANGNATQSTAQFKWGSQSAFFDGNGDSITSFIPAIGTGDFTIEMWAYLVSTAGDYSGLYDGRSGDTTSHPVLYLGSGVLSYYVTTANRITGPSVSTNTWHHIALARSAGTTRMYLNGSQAGSSWSDSTDYAASTAAYIGSLYNAGSMNGYLDDVRITVGWARYANSTYTVPTAAFPDA